MGREHSAYGTLPKNPPWILYDKTILYRLVIKMLLLFVVRTCCNVNTVLADMADLAVNADELIRSAYLEDRQMYFLQCAMEENCLASSAYQLRQSETDWHMLTRRLLRFTAKITNVGTAPFRPAIPKHLWQFHQCHMYVSIMYDNDTERGGYVFTRWPFVGSWKIAVFNN